jgi:hypothetical protein
MWDIGGQLFIEMLCMIIVNHVMHAKEQAD